MGDSARHVESPGHRAEGRHQGADRHRRRGPVRVQPPAPAPAPGALPRRRPGSRRPALATATVKLGRHPRGRTRPDRRTPPAAHQGRPRRRSGHHRLAPRARRARPPSTSTIRRILHAAALITPEPRKRPRSSYLRFEAAQPNECWQSDFTHWQPRRRHRRRDPQLARRPLPLPPRLHRPPPVTGDLVTSTFLTAQRRTTACPPRPSPTTAASTPPASPAARTPSSTSWPPYGIQQKNGHPGHPQTQGKIERFHQTLKRWLAQQPPAAT